MSSLLQLIRSGKNALVPKGKRFRMLPLGPASGCVMKVDLTNELRMYLGMYEVEIRPYFRKLIRPGYNSFDVGGRDGYYALLLGKISGGRVESFECEKAAADEMRETFGRNNYPITTVEAFIADQEDGSGTTTTLDAAAGRTFVPDFIKMDIEGAEAKALLGARAILADRKPSMIIEVHGPDIEAECVKILVSHGYEPQIVDQRAFFKEVRPIGHNRWLVCAGRARN